MKKVPQGSRTAAGAGGRRSRFRGGQGQGHPHRGGGHRGGWGDDDYTDDDGSFANSYGTAGGDFDDDDGDYDFDDDDRSFVSERVPSEALFNAAANASNTNSNIQIARLREFYDGNAKSEGQLIFAAVMTLAEPLAEQAQLLALAPPPPLQEEEEEPCSSSSQRRRRRRQQRGELRFCDSECDDLIEAFSAFVEVGLAQLSARLTRFGQQVSERERMSG